MSRAQVMCELRERPQPKYPGFPPASTTYLVTIEGAVTQDTEDGDLLLFDEDEIVVGRFRDGTWCNVAIILDKTS